ncbi:MAG: hypothetical protein ACRCX2_20235 [Paraclostridium sp.]
MLNILNLYGLKNHNPSSSRIGLEARSFMKAKNINIQRTDFILTPKATDLMTVYPIGMTTEDSLELFREISEKQSKMKVMRFKGYYLKPVIKETVQAKRILVNTRKIYMDVNKSKRDYNITTVSPRLSTFNNMSYMVDMSYLLEGIKHKTFDSGVIMSTKIREAILDIMKRNIVESSSNDRDKVLYFKGPFLSNTKIGLNIVDSALLKCWNPMVLFLEWFSKDGVGFKKWLRDNKINIIFDNGSGSSLVLSRNETYQNLPMYNFKFVLRMLHKLDNSNLKELGLSEDEIREIDLAITNSNTDITSDEEIVSKEDYRELERALNLELDSDSKDSGESEELLEEFQDIGEYEDFMTDRLSLTASDMEQIFNDVPEDEKATTLLETHNYTSIKKDMETTTVSTLRKKMMKNYGKDIKEVVNNLKNHQIEIAKFDNTIDNDYNQSNFVKLDVSYQNKLEKIDLENSLIAPSNLSIPLFLDNYSLEDISDREFRGNLLKAKYLTHQGEELEFELEVPTIINNSMFIGGSEKYLTNQDLAKPVIKTDQEVIITMAYNKTILAIKGKYGSVRAKMLVKTINNFASENDAIKVKTTEDLSDFIYDNRMSYEMLHMNKHFGGIRYVKDGIDIDFDFRGKKKDKTGLTLCGYVNSQEIIHNPEKDEFSIGADNEKYNTEDFLLKILALIDLELLEKSKVKKLDNLNFVNGVYCTIMARELPIVLVMLVETPLKDLLDRLKKENDLEYSIVKNEKLNMAKLKNNETYGYIKLEDYTIRIKYNNIINQLILVPLVNMDLTCYNIFDIAHILKDLVGSDNTSVYLENFASSFIDPGSKRVLEIYNMPTDFTGLFIYAASLFYDYKTYYSSDARNYRLVTPTEVINRIIYEIINKEFSSNVARTKRGSRQVIKIPRDAVIRSLSTTMTNISEDSNISPFRTIMLKSSKSQKGHMGVNMNRAYNMKRRMFNENNLGTETFATAYSGQAGIIKYLPFNPKIKDLTGTYEGQDTPEGLTDSNLNTFVDSYVPYLSFDDSPRRLMVNGGY